MIPETQPLRSTKELSSEYFSQARNEMFPFVPADTKTLLDLGCSNGGFGYLVKSRLGAEAWVLN